MEAKEFTVFSSLLSDVYAKAFGEQISRLPHGKAQTLCWLIHEATGELLSYKTLGNYVAAVLAGNSSAINPSDATLAILAQFVSGNDAHQAGRHEMRAGAYAAWYKYRSGILTRSLAA
ncbi:MAG: hypothetical protein OHK0019_12450 [Saprospiraceae bacterium]